MPGSQAHDHAEWTGANALDEAPPAIRVRAQGTTARPLDGGALSHGRSTRAGEGADGRAKPHPASCRADRLRRLAAREGRRERKQSSGLRDLDHGKPMVRWAERAAGQLERRRRRRRTQAQRKGGEKGELGLRGSRPSPVLIPREWRTTVGFNPTAESDWHPMGRIQPK